MTFALFTPSEPVEGFLVTIDGPNAAGKTAIAREIAEGLAATGHKVHPTRQPSASPLGELARASEVAVAGRALACLVAADRHHQLMTEILPALHSGAVVVCDRYIESSLVLQRIDEVDTEFILAANSGIRRPDLRVRLAASEPVLTRRIAERAGARGRRFEPMSGGPAREVQLYAEADELLVERYGLRSLFLETTSSTPAEQGRLVVQHIDQLLRERG